MPPNSPPGPSGSGAGGRRTENLDLDTDDNDDGGDSSSGSGDAYFDGVGLGGARGSDEEPPPPPHDDVMADHEDFGCVQGFLGSLSPFSARKQPLAFAAPASPAPTSPFPRSGSSLGESSDDDCADSRGK